MKKILTLLFFTPFLVSAAGVTNWLDKALSIVTGVLIPLAFSLCLFYFFWGMVKYIKSEGSGKGEGRKIMIWGIVGLFIAFSIWGIIALIKSDLGILDVANPGLSFENNFLLNI